MIEWNNLDDFERRLKHYPPIGLRLRPWFHARCDVDPATEIGRAPETQEEEGLGPIDVWCGFVDTVPFALRSRAHPDPKSGFGFEIAFPTRPGADTLFLSEIQKLPLPSWHTPYFDQLPTNGGFGVVRLGDDSPIYASNTQEDATAVADFVSSATEVQYGVIPVGPSDPCWIVVGPMAGPYISWLETMSSEENAKRQATRWSAVTGAQFEVRRYL